MTTINSNYSTWKSFKACRNYCLLWVHNKCNCSLLNHLCQYTIGNIQLLHNVMWNSRNNMNQGTKIEKKPSQNHWTHSITLSVITYRRIYFTVFTLLYECLAIQVKTFMWLFDCIFDITLVQAFPILRLMFALTTLPHFLLTIWRPVSTGWIFVSHLSSSTVLITS